MHGFIVDFYCAAAKLVVEVDGGIHDELAVHDRERDVVLREAGCHVLRVSVESVMNDPQGVAKEVIATMVSLGVPSPAKRGRGGLHDAALKCGGGGLCLLAIAWSACLPHECNTNGECDIGGCWTGDDGIRRCEDRGDGDGDGDGDVDCGDGVVCSAHYERESARVMLEIDVEGACFGVCN